MTIVPDHTQNPRIGVLLVNLGTPEAPSAAAIRRYLREFLSDRRVVDLPPVLWWPILYGIVLPLRSRRLVHAYASVWTDDGSPLMSIGRAQCKALQDALGEDAVVMLAMRYGQPSIGRAVTEMQRQGVRRLLVLPLYPQYSATTTASVYDAVFDAVRALRWPPELRTINGYHDDPAHVAALAESVRAHWARRGRGDHLLMSFHSIPLRYFEAGDPYFCFCQKTARLLAAALQLQPDQWSVAFQSRVGTAKWLSPYTDVRIAELAGHGVRALDVICPGFAADCLETLEEVAQRYDDLFRRSGGAALRYVPALNAEPAHVAALADLVRRHTASWPVPGPGDPEREQRMRVLTAELDER